jgi:NodT family efflux transporter outer membrane factor (OMF) lipoprotein
MRNSRASILLVSLAAAFLTGCTTVGPDYEAPVPTVPDVWFETAVAGVAEGDASLQTWWTQLDDPTLVSLIERAGASNLDLREAVARINEARANLGIVSGERLPRVDAAGDASRTQLSDNGALDQVAPESGFQAQNLFGLGLDASWEIDVFGRIRRSIESAQASYEASLEDYRDVMVTLFAAVARNYIGVRETQTRIRFAETNAAAQRATLRLTRDRHDAGATSGLDVVQAESNLRNTEAQIPSLKIQLNAYLNALAVLLGDYPGALDEELEPEAPLPLPPPELTVSIPADLLRQRPDIRARERALAAQTARIGVATADLYPRFSLSGFFAVSARDVGDLFDGDSVTWGISLPIRWQLFDRGRIRSAIDLEQARTDQALVAYERTVLQAFAEVENSLVAYSLERTRRDSLAAATFATQRAVELVSIQYQEGLADFQNVLDMERSLSTQQDQLAVSEGQILQDLIALYKALGGGWDPDQEPPPVPEN